MTPIIEVPIPPVPAEQREPLLVPFDPGTGTDVYVNALYEYVHKLAMSGEDRGAGNVGLRRADGTGRIDFARPPPSKS